MVRGIPFELDQTNNSAKKLYAYYFIPLLEVEPLQLVFASPIPDPGPLRYQARVWNDNPAFRSYLSRDSFALDQGQSITLEAISTVAFEDLLREGTVLEEIDPSVLGRNRLHVEVLSQIAVGSVKPEGEKDLGPDRSMKRVFASHFDVETGWDTEFEVVSLGNAGPNEVLLEARVQIPGFPQVDVPDGKALLIVRDAAGTQETLITTVTGGNTSAVIPRDNWVSIEAVFLGPEGYGISSSGAMTIP